MQNKSDNCWLWSGARRGDGRGQVFRKTKAHRYVYEQLVGPIPEGLQIDHLCKNVGCVRPDHLEPVPEIVNHNREFGIWKNGGTCHRGHERTPENRTKRYMRGDGRLTAEFCKPCNRIWYAEVGRFRRKKG